jgi:tight adherence protein C
VSVLYLVMGLASLFVALVVMLATIGVITEERQAVGRSLAVVEALRSAPAAMRREIEAPFSDRVGLPLLHVLSRLGRKLTPNDQSVRLARRLALIGSPAGWDAERVLAFKVLGLLAGVTVGFVFPWALGAGLLVALGVSALAGLTAFFMPNVVLFDKAQRRSERIRRDLPNALDMLMISVEAGLGFDAALAQVARNTEGPLADEFFRVLQEMQIGMGRTEAIRALGDRTSVPDLRSFTTAMVQADKFGIPIAEVLRIQAREMRLKRRQRAEEMAQKVPVKILFPLIFCIMPTLMVVILGPAIIQLLDFFG